MRSILTINIKHHPLRQYANYSQSHTYYDGDSENINFYPLWCTGGVVDDYQQDCVLSIQTIIRAEKRYQDFSAEHFMPRGSLCTIWQEWSALRQKGPSNLPFKQAISMQRFKSALPDMLITERVGPQDIRIRLSGTRIDEMQGTVISGKNLLDVVRHHIRNRINTIYDCVSSYPCGFYISEDIELRSDKTMELDILVLPLADKAGDRTFYLAGYHFSNRHLFNPFEDKAIQLKPRKINKVGFIDLGSGTPKRD